MKLKQKIILNICLILYKIVLLLILWIGVHVSLPGMCYILRRFDAWGHLGKTFNIHLNSCFLDFMFVLLTALSLKVVSHKSRHLGFYVRLSWASALSFFMQIRHGPSDAPG